MGPDPYRVAADLLDPPPHPYQGRPADWVRDHQHDHLTVDEARILDAVAEHRYVAVHASHSAGKSWTAANVLAHWIETWPDGTAFAISTAPTDAQVKAVLWREIGRVHRKGKLKGRLTEAAQWKLRIPGGPDELVAYGRKPAVAKTMGGDAETAVGLIGTHAEHVLVVIDEAGGVPQAIFDAVDGLTTGEDAHVLAIGHPDDPNGPFAKACKPGSGWHVIHLDGLRSPNMTASAVAKFPALRAYMIAEGVPPSTEEVPDSVRPLLLSPRWVDERLKRWGPTNPLFVSRARGLFPKITRGSLIEPAWVLAAQQRDTKPQPIEGRMGVDPARYGADKSIVVLRQGPHARVAVEIGYGPTVELTGEVLALGRSLAPQIPPASVDEVGIGGGVVDELAEAGWPVLPLNGGAAHEERLPDGTRRFVNARSGWYWQLRQVLAGPSGTGEDGYLDLDPDDEELAAQLVGIRVRYTSRGQTVVESKDEMASRGLPSPDRADALVYSLVAELPREVIATGVSLTADLLDARW